MPELRGLGRGLRSRRAWRSDPWLELPGRSALQETAVETVPAHSGGNRKTIPRPAPADIMREGRIIWAALTAVFVLISFGASAQDGHGRYQAIAIPQASNSISSGNVLLLDTRDGHVWEWWHSPTMGNVAGGAGITYMGKLIPRGAPGEIVQRYRYGQ
jgi:hypothetical protein